mgnify:CR=1 FL=1
MADVNISDNHWQIETYRQRMTRAEWRAILLAERDTINFEGRARHLQAKDLGYGVVEVSKIPLPESKTTED